jgi:hypothetical protein
MSRRWGSTPRQTDWLTVSRSVTLTLTADTVVKLLLVATTSTTRQQQTYMSSECCPASGQTTRPASAEPTRALPTGKNLRSTSCTSAPAHRQPSAEKLGQLPTCCLPNPACCRSSTLAFGCTQLALFRARTSSSVATFAVRKLPVRLHIQRARTVVLCYVVVLRHLTSPTWLCFDTPLVLFGSVSTCVHSHTLLTETLAQFPVIVTVWCVCLSYCSLNAEDIIENW